MNTSVSFPATSRRSVARHPVWTVSVLVAAAVLAGCADMSGITPQARLRDPASVGLWWRRRRPLLQRQRCPPNGGTPWATPSLTRWWPRRCRTTPA